MGYYLFDDPKVGVVLAAVVEAILLNRTLGGLPYPLWRADPKIVRNYRSLAGLSGATRTAWQELALRTARRRHRSG